MGGSVSVVMTSVDQGVTWITQTSALPALLSGIAYGNQAFVAVSIAGGVMTSSDGVNWLVRPAAASNAWTAVTFGAGTFVAVSGGWPETNQVMTSDDNGSTWDLQATGASVQWTSVAYGNGRFVAVANTGVDRVMVSVVPVIESGPPPPPWLQSYALSGDETNCMDGWSQSWAQWPNDNSGGFVCNRSIYWSSGAQAWLEKPGF